MHASDTQSPADEIARSEITAAFRRAMLELPLQHREIIALCDLEELPYTTVAGHPRLSRWARYARACIARVRFSPFAWLRWS